MKEIYRKKALLLSFFTVGYNLLEGVAALVIGAASGSSALIGFGLDSFIESISGSVMIWRFGKQRTHEEEEAVEAKAVKLVGYSFFILGGYVVFDAAKQLLSGDSPEKSLFGVLIAVLSLIVMPSLFLAKNRLGKQMGSHSLVADSKQTLACIMLSLILLIGLGLNYLFGISWADPLAAIIIAVLLFREGRETLTKKELCC